MSPGTNAGTGAPLTFRCWGCRQGYRSRRGWSNRVQLTGGWRIHPTAATRTANVSVQYECRDCGHIGWSRHVDLVTLATRHIWWPQDVFPRTRGRPIREPSKAVALAVERHHRGRT